MPKKSWYSIEAKKGSKEADVVIYEEIGFWGISAKQFINDVKDLAVDTINLRLNTPGGSVFDGTAIFNVLKDHKASVVVHIDGLAASMGSFIAMAGDEIRMAKNAFMMIHNPWGLAVGDSVEMEKMASLLDKMTGTLASTYADKSGQTEEHVRGLMAEETWFTGEEALAEGLVDVVTGAVEVNASFDLSKFEKVPQAITEHFTAGQPSIRNLEHALRDAGGLSLAEAKTVLAKGYSALEQRDADLVPQRDVEDVLTDEPEEAEVKSIDELKAQHPELYQAAFDAGKDSVDIDAAVAKAKEVEVARVKDVKAQSMPGFEKDIEAMVADGETTGEQAAMKIVALQQAQMAAAKDGIKKDAAGVNVPEAPTGALGAGEEGEDKDFDALVTACMKDKDISKAKAISMVAKEHPEAHEAYLKDLKADKEAA